MESTSTLSTAPDSWLASSSTASYKQEQDQEQQEKKNQEEGDDEQEQEQVSSSVFFQLVRKEMMHSLMTSSGDVPEDDNDDDEEDEEQEQEGEGEEGSPSAAKGGKGQQSHPNQRFSTKPYGDMRQLLLAGLMDMMESSSHPLNDGDEDEDETVTDTSSYNNNSSDNSNSKNMQSDEVGGTDDDDDDGEDEKDCDADGDGDGDIQSQVSDITAFTRVLRLPQTSPSKPAALPPSPTKQILIEDMPNSSIISNNNNNNKMVNNATAQKPKRKVHFQHVYIRRYERILCDNPSCSSGPSIGIGWAYRDASRPRTVQEVERDRYRRPARSMTELMLTRQQRFRLVQSLGYSEKEIAQMIRIVSRIRNQRRKTVNNIGFQKMQEAFEKVRRKFTKMLSLSPLPSSSQAPDDHNSHNNNNRNGKSTFSSINNKLKQNIQVTRVNKGNKDMQQEMEDALPWKKHMVMVVTLDATEAITNDEQKPKPGQPEIPPVLVEI